MDLTLTWLIAGVILILAEFVIPGFVICFFGVSAVITGMLRYFIPALPFTWQILLFTVLGVVLLLVCRRFMPGIFRGKENVENTDIDSDDIAGNCCICTEAIASGIPGKVEFRGSIWTALSSDTIAPGERCVIHSRNNLTLEVSKL